MDNSFELDDSASLFLSAVLKIGFGLAIFITITFLVWVYSVRHYIAENIDKYKCKPYIIPIINFFDSEVDTSENFKKCLGTNNQTFFNTVSQPIVHATGSITDSMAKASDAVGVLTDGVMHIGSVMQNKVEASNTELDKLNSVFVYFLMKVKAVFDKVGGLLNNAYGGLQSIMDTVNIVLVLPEMVMQIFGFLVMLFTLIVAVLIIMFTVNYVLGISFTSLGIALLPNPFTTALGAIWVAMGGVLINYIAMGIYMAAIIITTIFLGVILSIYIPVKQRFEAASRSSYCCFSSDTPVKLDSGDYKPISSLCLGQAVAGGGTVHGILYSKMPEVDAENWVTVKAVSSEKVSCLVYKTHKLFSRQNSPPMSVGELKDKEDGKMFQILSLSDEDTHRLKNKEKWCLVTTYHRIESIDGIVFTDYQEVIEKSHEMELLASRILKKLNPLCFKNIQKEFEYGEMNFGFTGDTLVLLEEKAVKKIQDIKVGDILQDSNEVIGIYICTPQETIQPCVVHGVQVPPQQILSTTISNWIKAYMSSEKEIKSIYSKSNLLYHLVTSSGDYKLLSRLNNQEIKVLDFVSNGTLETEYKN
jgi:hypothetical protein